MRHVWSVVGRPSSVVPTYDLKSKIYDSLGIEKPRTRQGRGAATWYHPDFDPARFAANFAADRSMLDNGERPG
ncbi:MAG TPA: hypothetical protein VLQ48_07820 [Chloroflexia bacterium]|nr:hypothetical protein [Chloroflexia bacterium]